MKKAIILSFFIAMLSLFQLQAQEFQGGLLAGLNASQVAGDDLAGYNKAGIVGGGFVRYAFNNPWGVQMEIKYSQKGSAHTPTELNPLQYLLRVNYIDIPVLAQFDFSKWFTLEMGASYSYFINAFEERNYSQDVVNRGFNSASVNFIGGIAFHYNNLSVNVRTSNGLTPLRPDPTKEYTKRLGSAGQYNDVLTIAVYYNLGTL